MSEIDIDNKNSTKTKGSEWEMNHSWVVTVFLSGMVLFEEILRLT